MNETALVRQILDYCKYRDLMFWRNQSGQVKTVNKYGDQHMMRLGILGSPDIIGCMFGWFIGVEAKVGKNKQTDYQKDFEKRLIAAGGLYKVVYTLDEFIEFIDEIKSKAKAV